MICRPLIARSLICFAMVISSVVLSYGQRGYYITDSSIVHGVQIVTPHTDVYSKCELVEDSILREYGPHEIKGYGIVEGDRYISFSIKRDSLVDSYFLREVISGTISLYFLKLKDGYQQYFLKTSNDPELIPIPKGKEQIQQIFSPLIVDCPHSAEKIQHLKYKKHRIKRFINEHNSCSQNPYPIPKFTIYAGIKSVHLVNGGRQNPLRSYLSYPPVAHLGISFEKPLFSSDFSAVIDANLSFLKITESYDKLNTSYDLIIDISSCMIPLNLRYKILKNHFAYFLQGGIHANLLVRNNTSLFEYDYIDEDILINYTSDLLGNYMAGAQLGFGVIWDCFTKQSIMAEAGYSYSQDIYNNLNSMSYHQIFIHFGICF